MATIFNTTFLFVEKKQHKKLNPSSITRVNTTIHTILKKKKKKNIVKLLSSVVQIGKGPKCGSQISKSRLSNYFRKWYSLLLAKTSRPAAVEASPN